MQVYVTLMVEIHPTKTRITLREMKEISLSLNEYFLERMNENNIDL